MPRVQAGDFTLTLSENAGTLIKVDPPEAWKEEGEEGEDLWLDSELDLSEFLIVAIAPGAFSDCELLYIVKLQDSLSFKPSDFPPETLVEICFPSEGFLATLCGEELCGIKKISPDSFDTDRLRLSTSSNLKISIIGRAAFEPFEGLASLCLPERLREIRAYAFEGCGQLTQLDLRGCSNLESVAQTAFDGSRVEYIHIDDSLSAQAVKELKAACMWTWTSVSRLTKKIESPAPVLGSPPVLFRNSNAASASRRPSETDQLLLDEQNQSGEASGRPCCAVM
jgi:hypothetical protein